MHVRSDDRDDHYRLDGGPRELGEGRLIYSRSEGLWLADLLGVVVVRESAPAALAAASRALQRRACRLVRAGRWLRSER